MIPRFPAVSGRRRTARVSRRRLGSDAAGCPARCVRGPPGPAPTGAKRTRRCRWCAAGRQRAGRTRRLSSAGRCASAVPSSAASVGCSSARKVGQLAELVVHAGRLGGVRAGGVARLSEEPAHVAAALRHLRQDRVGVAVEVADRAPLARQNAQHAVDLAQRRVGAADDLVQVVAAARQAEAQLGEQDREALAVGPAHDVLHQVGRDDRRRLLGPGSCRRLGKRSPLLPGSQSMKYSPMSDCGRVSQVTSLAQVAEAALGELELDLGEHLRCGRGASSRRSPRARPPRARRSPR